MSSSSSSKELPAYATEQDVDDCVDLGVLRAGSAAKRRMTQLPELQPGRLAPIEHNSTESTWEACAFVLPSFPATELGARARSLRSWLAN